MQCVKITLTSFGKKSWQPLTKEFNGTESVFRSSSPSQEIKKFPHFLKPNSLSSCSQQSVTYSYAQPVKSSLRTPSLYF